MRKSILAILAAILAMGCVMSAIQATPTPSSPTATRHPLPTETATATPRATDEPEVVRQVSRVIVPVVRVHVAPDVESAVEHWLTAGQAVTVLACRGDWCEIESPPGYVYIGCLEGLSDRGCVASEGE